MLDSLCPIPHVGYMNTCRKCGSDIPRRVRHAGKLRDLHSRRFCLRCTPFGSHNTYPFGPPAHKYICGGCGTTDPKKFYKRKRNLCDSCHMARVYKRLKANKTFICQTLGGKCIACGYDRYEVSLAVHHLDPTKKSPKAQFIRTWPKARILRELRGCVLLCHNCHSAVHAGLLKLPGV